MVAAGLPLAASKTEGAEAGNEAGSTKITAVISFLEGLAEAYVASPSGIVYRFSPSVFEPEWWSFALRNYYCVTGNFADREALAASAGITAWGDGKTLIRKKSDQPSGLSLVALMRELTPA